MVIGQAPKLHEGPYEFGEAQAFDEDILQLGKLGQTLLLDRFDRSAFDKVRQLGYNGPFTDHQLPERWHTSVCIQ